MATPWSRRAPWPHDVEIDVGDGTGWHGLVLEPGQDGLLVGRETAFLGDVAPTSYEYGAARPDEETTFVFGRLTGGMGEAVQSSATSTRYRYATGVDCSIAGMPRLGPAFTQETFPGLPAGNRVVQLIEVNPITSDEVIALVGRYAYKRTGGAWTLSRDFGVGVRATQAVRFAGATGTGGVFVADDGGALTRYAGGAWTVAAGTPGAAYALAVNAGQLWMADFAGVRVASNDPTVGANWGGNIQVGDQNKRITNLAAVGDVVYVFKQEGIYTVNADGSVNELRPELRTAESVINGQNAVAWRDALWFGYGNDAFYSLDAGGTMTPVGPELLVDNGSPVRGRVVSAAPHATWFLYAAVYNAATGDSHLLKYGGWTPDAERATGRFSGVWHGAVASWTGKAVTRLDYAQRNPPGLTTGGALLNPGLWVGFADGTVQWTTLPTGTPDPALDPNCRFRTTGQLYWPLHDAVFGADRKAFHGATALGPVLTANQTARQFWRVDAGSYNQLAPDFTASGQRVEFPDQTTGAARDAATGLQLDAYTELRSTVDTATPVLEGVALHEAVRPAAGKPALRLAWTMTVRAANRVVRRDGVVGRTTAEATRALLRAAAGAAGHVRLRLPDETVGGFAAVEYGETLAPDRGRDGMRWGIPVRFIQLR